MNSSIVQCPERRHELGRASAASGARLRGFNEDWQRRRFSIRPGITCLWQVNGRSSISFEKWMELDLQYMDEWSLWLDLKSLAWTVPAVLRGSGAA